uniref:Uncharacterized protein n=1 Tax=Romanomermis culicivorax TaxID=13658 RepID=A0A915K2R3_ROMCU
MAVPLLKSAGKHAPGSKVAGEVATGRTFKDSVSDHGREAVGQVLHGTADRIVKGQKGKGSNESAHNLCS